MTIPKRLIIQNSRRRVSKPLQAEGSETEAETEVETEVLVAGVGAQGPSEPRARRTVIGVEAFIIVDAEVVV